MNFLLDRFTPTTSPFRPKTPTEVFACRLAQKLGDAKAGQHYLSLTERHTEAQLIHAYRRTMQRKGLGDLGQRFHVELAQGHPNGHHDHQARLMAVRIERRTVAAAIFQGDHLEYADARQLSSARDKAVASAVGFVNWMLARFPVESVALESIPNDGEFQRRVLHDAICSALRERATPIWEIPKAVLLEGYGDPPLKSRQQLREIATSVWPVIAGTRAKVFIQDAAALGLHVQIERLFIIN
jgi:hypothetical protein